MKKSNRRVLRERTLQVLYAYEMHREDLTRLTNGILADIDNKADKDFGISLINKVVGNTPEIDKKIFERVANWELNRIALIDKLLLRIGIAELMFFPDIPPKVSINEVIEIAKEYSTAKSGKFINGILDGILIDLRDKGELKKSGRGLVDVSLPKKS